MNIHGESKIQRMFQNYLHWAHRRAVCHLLGKNSTSLESLFFYMSIERLRSVIGKIVVELQLFEWNKFADRLQAKRTLFIYQILLPQKMLFIIFVVRPRAPFFFEVSSFVFYARTEMFWPFWADGIFKFFQGGWSWKNPRSCDKFLSSYWTVSPVTPFSIAEITKNCKVRHQVNMGDAEELWEICPRWIWKWMRRCEAKLCRNAGSNYRANVAACDQHDTRACEVQTDNTHCLSFDWRITRSGIPCRGSRKRPKAWFWTENVAGIRFSFALLQESSMWRFPVSTEGRNARPMSHLQW